MRDAFYIFGLFAFFLLLAADFPAQLAEDRPLPARKSTFASFVELPPSVHAAYLESARTTWQVRSGSRGRPVIGSLDSGVPLLTDSLPPREKVVFGVIEIPDMPVGATDIGAYSLVPATGGADSPVFCARPANSCAPGDSGGDASAPFRRSDMLSIDNYGKLKEIMQ